MSVTRNYPLPRAVDDFPWPEGDEPEFPLATKFGAPMITALRQTMVDVTGGIPHNVESGADTALTIRGVVYSVQCHFHLWSDGKWHAGREDSREQWREPNLSRRDSYVKNVSSAAQRAAREVLEVRVGEWLECHPGVLESAERRYRAEGAHRLARQIDEETGRRQKLIDNLDACLSGEPFSMYPNSRS